MFCPTLGKTLIFASGSGKRRLFGRCFEKGTGCNSRTVPAAVNPPNPRHPDATVLSGWEGRRG
jgi:hypothetical protein